VVDDKGILRSTQESNESFKGTNPQPGGPPGTTSNIPGYVTGNANSQSTFEKKDATRNYEINETKEKTVVAPGGIKRISVGVLIDASISKAQQDSVAKAVASAAGINVARGDAISVETVPFSTEIADKIKKEEQDLAQEQQKAQWTKYGAGAAVVLLIAGVGFWVLKRRQEEELEVLTMESAVTAGEADDVDSVSEQAINAIKDLSPAERVRNAEMDAIETLSKAKPEEVAMLLKTWLAEE
jgi:flagellar M-ring protein FliF